jgi:hypothetical protein
MFGQNASLQKVQASNTQNAKFPAGGTLRVARFIGELTVEGWDKPDAEITITKTTREFYNTPDRAKGTRELDGVQVSARPHETELIVSTDYHRRRKVLPLIASNGAAGVDLHCLIRVPQTAKVVIERGSGNVFVRNFTGSIQAGVRQGEITLGLPEQGQYSIDARSQFGNVVSDFAGQTKGAGFFVGHRFSGNGASTAQQVNLRVQYGDILVFTEPKAGVTGQMQ